MLPVWWTILDQVNGAISSIRIRCNTHLRLQSNVYVHGSNVDVCHCNAHLIISHTMACARWQETVEFVAIAESLLLFFFDLFDRLSAYACLVDFAAMSGYSFNQSSMIPLS
jgi:hypothetical protein